MNTRQYLYMITIAECGYLSAAAERLGVSQAALSKFLATQEEFLDVELFMRYKKRLYPTAAGTIYLEAAYKILNAKNRTLNEMGKLLDSPSSTIRVAFTPYRGSALFGQIYSKFEAVFPGVDLQLEETFSAQQELKVHQRNVDFAMGVNCHTNFNDVYNLPISREELILAVSIFHPLAQYASKNHQQLTAMPIRMFWDTPFCLPSRHHNIRRVAEDLFEKSGFNPVIAFESDNGIAVESMIEQGVGAGIIPQRYVKQGDNLVYFRIDPYCYEITYIRYAIDREFSHTDRYLCSLMIRERLSSKYHSFISSTQATALLEYSQLNKFV